MNSSGPSFATLEIDSLLFKVVSSCFKLSYGQIFFPESLIDRQGVVEHLHQLVIVRLETATPQAVLIIGVRSMLSHFLKFSLFFNFYILGVYERSS